jgi:hypothetical protein
MSCPSSRTRTPDNGRPVFGGCVGDTVFLTGPEIEPRIRRLDGYRGWNSQLPARHGTRRQASSHECGPSESFEHHDRRFIGSDCALYFLELFVLARGDGGEGSTESVAQSSAEGSDNGLPLACRSTYKVNEVNNGFHHSLPSVLESRAMTAFIYKKIVCILGYSVKTKTCRDYAPL